MPANSATDSVLQAPVDRRGLDTEEVAQEPPPESHRDGEQTDVALSNDGGGVLQPDLEHTRSADADVIACLASNWSAVGAQSDTFRGADKEQLASSLSRAVSSGHNSCIEPIVDTFCRQVNKILSCRL